MFGTIKKTNVRLEEIMRRLDKKFGIYAILGILLLSGMLTVTVKASKKPARDEKYVTSVLIKKGDTLWKIAKEFFAEENSSMKAYIEEIKKCNHLSSNQIKAGNNLIIPYYEKNH